MVATVFLPARDATRDGVTVVFAGPGGGYARGYFDMAFPGHRDYSQADHHVERNLAFVAIDHLGVGQSTPEVCDRLRVEDIAAANHLAVEAISAKLSNGMLVDGYPAVPITRRIGIGQSMGGAVTIVMAARHRTYDAVVILGYSAIHTVLPFPSDDESREVADRVGGKSRRTAPDELSIAGASALIPQFLYPFFHADVPADIVQADIGGGYPFRESAPPFGSVSLPSCAAAMLSPGYVAEDAAAVRCPVFVGVGDRDVAPHPLREPAAYESASDVTVFICEGMAHMHNFASTRVRLWDRLTSWYAALEY